MYQAQYDKIRSNNIDSISESYWNINNITKQKTTVILDYKQSRSRVQCLKPCSWHWEVPYMGTRT